MKSIKVYKNRSALMNAAKTGSPEGVDMLLKAGADPNTEDSVGMTALAYGIVSGNIDVINLLAPVTSAGVDQIIIKLAQSILNIEGELENYLKKFNGDEKMKFLLEKASFYGNEKLLDYLLNKSNHVMSEDSVRKAFEIVIKTDKVKPVQCISQYYESKRAKKFLKFPSFFHFERRRNTVRTRNVAKVLDKARTNSTKPKYQILNKVPKSEEFDYTKLMEEISSLILEAYPSAGGRLIKYETLIKRLHAQAVHYEGQHFKENTCPDDCSQKTVCGRIRDVLYLLDQIMKKMSEEFPIFKDVICITVGSIKEQTKIGKIDETDVLLAMDKKYQ